jgi:pimeloyl-ACP methyl ester carboxylesterase
MNATSWLEKARLAIQNSPIDLKMDSPNGGFRVSQLSGITLHAQTGLKAAAFQDIDTWPPADLAGVDRLAFGSYRSPQFLVGGMVIPNTPSGADVPLPAVSARIYFHAYLPAGPVPARGFPVVIVGHGYGAGRFRTAPSIAATLAAAGFASIAIDAVGHGYGPQSTLLIKTKDGAVAELPAVGRGLDFDGNGVLDQGEGCYLYAGSQVIVGRDCWRQTALDTMQLVRAIQAGVDLTGVGRPELDSARIFYVGHSMGAVVGTILNAVEPGIQAAVLNGGGGTSMDLARWGGNPLAIAILALRKPALLNLPGPDYDMDWPLRDQPPMIIKTPGAVAIQELAERIEWNTISGDPLAYAPHLRTAPLANVPAKRILYQFGIGDRQALNPYETNEIRAAGLREMTSLYRHDLAFSINPSLGVDPHDLAFPRYTDSAAQKEIGHAIQRQAADFLSGDGLSVPDANGEVRLTYGRNLFEVPAVLPMGFNFVSLLVN